MRRIPFAVRSGPDGLHTQRWLFAKDGLLASFMSQTITSLSTVSFVSRGEEIRARPSGGAQHVAHAQSVELQQCKKATAAITAAVAFIARRNSKSCSTASVSWRPISNCANSIRAASFAATPLLPTQQLQLDQAQAVQKLVMTLQSEHIAAHTDVADNAHQLAAACDLGDWPNDIELPDDRGARIGMLAAAAIEEWRADSTRRKRKHKMNKHKHKKRRKANRHKT